MMAVMVEIPGTTATMEFPETAEVEDAIKTTLDDGQANGQEQAHSENNGSSLPESNGSANGSANGDGHSYGTINGEEKLFPDYLTLQREFKRLREELSQREKYETEVAECSRDVERLAGDVMRCESAVESAKGRLKAAREDYDSKVSELRGLLRDQTTGQGRLFFAGDTATEKPEAGTVAAPTETVAATKDDRAAAEITVLSQDAMRDLVGVDEFQSAKDGGNPIGMTDREIELLRAADINTVGQLEQRMREDEWWHSKIGKGWGEAKTDKVVNSLLKFRERYPQPVSE